MSQDRSAWPPPKAPVTQGYSDFSLKLRRLWLDLILCGASFLVSGVAFFLAFINRTCQQGDWLTCSGRVTYGAFGGVMMFIGFAVPFLALVVNCLFLDSGKGSIGMRRAGACVVYQDTGHRATRHSRFLRSLLNTLFLGASFFVATLTIVPFAIIPAVIEYAFAASGRRRFLDRLLGLDIRPLSSLEGSSVTGVKDESF